MTRHDGGSAGGRPPVGARGDAGTARPSRPVRPPASRVPQDDRGGPGPRLAGPGAEQRGIALEPGDRTTPFYPTQRGRDEIRPAATPVPVAAHTPATAVLPVRGAGPLDDHTAPLPRTGEEPLARRAGPTSPTEGSGGSGGSGGDGAADPAEVTAEADTGWDLVHAAQQGDAEAFGGLFDRYHDVVFRFVLYRLSDRHLAEDLTQETFVRAYRRLDSVTYQGRDIGAWLVTIARNLVLDHVKSSRHRLESPIGEVTEVVADRVSPGPEGEVVAGVVHAELLRCVDRLRSDQRECIDLRFLQGLSVSETAAAMDRNEGAVKALQHRAVRRLAQLMPEGLR